MTLVERRTQVEQLDTMLSDCRRGRGRVALVEGPVTTGRTALLREVGSLAAQAGVRHLRATCSAEEHALPFGVMAQLFSGAALSAEVRDEAAELLRGQLSDSSYDEAVRVCHHLSSALLREAEAEPLLITIDDARHADESSLRCLLQLVRRIESVPMMLVFADQVDPGRPHHEFHAELVRQPHFAQIQVGPLSPAGVRALASDVPGLHEHSGGNPLLAAALIDDHRAGGEPRVTGYGQAVLIAVRRAGVEATRAVRALAVLGSGAAAADLAALSDVDEDEIAHALRRLTLAGVLTGGWFRHPVAANAVLMDIAAEDRAELHHRAARIGHDRGLPAKTVAEHLVRAEHASGEWVAEVLLDAARHELSQHRADEAMRYLTRGRQTCVSGPTGAAIHSLLAQSEWHRNPASVIRHLDPLDEAGRDGHLGARDSVALLRHLLWFHRFPQASTVLERLRADQGLELRDTEMWLAVTYPALYRKQPETGQNGRIWIGGDPWLRSTAALARLLASGHTEDIEPRVEQVLRNLHLHQNAPWAEEAALLALYSLLYGDRVATATAWCDRLEKECGHWGPMWRAVIAAVRAEIAIRDCELGAAVKYAKQALEEAPERAWGVAIGLPLGSLILAHTRLGEVEEAAKYAARPVPDALLRSRYGLHYLYARGHHHLATNGWLSALTDFLSCGELMQEWNLDIPGLVPWRACAAEAWLRLSRQEQAERLIGEELARQGSGRSRARGMCLRLLASTKPVDRRLGLLTEAADVLEGCGDQYELARVLADLGRTHRLLGDHRRARVAVQRAWHVANIDRGDVRDTKAFPGFGNLDTGMIKPRVATEPAVARPCQGVDSLTESERRVAALAAMGYTNREIARKLFVTGSTVEQHLTRVYRKLKVRQRKELPASLRADVVRTA